MRAVARGREVIGSVLVLNGRELTRGERVSMSESVSQAAPVLGNLRNLALAQRRAATDALTGLPNHRTVMDTVKSMAAQAMRSATPLAAVALDLDRFKEVNDTHGHAKGDDVLAAVGATLKSCIRDSDVAGRTGGEEFVLLLSNTAIEGASVVAEKVRERIETLDVSGLHRPTTASLGIALLPLHALDGESLLRHADQALYAAKRNGRNRVETFAGASTEDTFAGEAPPQLATGPATSSPAPAPASSPAASAPAALASSS